MADEPAKGGSAGSEESVERPGPCLDADEVTCMQKSRTSDPAFVFYHRIPECRTQTLREALASLDVEVWYAETRCSASKTASPHYTSLFW